MKPITTLFLLQSVDGKISTGPTDDFDVDKDIPKMSGDPATGLQQYYDEEAETDLWSMNSGRVMAKVGMNDRTDVPHKTPVTFVVVDNHHIKESGIRYMCTKFKRLIIITSNSHHPAFSLKDKLENLNIYQYFGEMNPKEVLDVLGEQGCENLTIQTGGTLNCVFLRNKLIDKINIVVCPILVGGKNVSSLIDGTDPTSLDDIGVLKLTSVRTLNNSYIQLKYDVVQ